NAQERFFDLQYFAWWALDSRRQTSVLVKMHLCAHHFSGPDILGRIRGDIELLVDPAGDDSCYKGIADVQSAVRPMSISGSIAIKRPTRPTGKPIADRT